MDEILKKQGFPDMGEITMEQVWDVFNQLNPMEKRSLSSALEVLVEHSNGKVEEVDETTEGGYEEGELSQQEIDQLSHTIKMNGSDVPDLMGPDRDSSMHSSSDGEAILGKTIIIHDDQLEKTFSMVKLDNDEPPFPADPKALHIPFTSEQLSETSNLMKWVGATDMRTFIWEYEAIIRAIFAAWNGDHDVENLEFYLVYYLPFFVSLGVIYSLEAEFGYRTFEVQGLDKLDIEEDAREMHQRCLAGSWREIRRFVVGEFAAIKDDEEFISHTMSLLENVAVSKRGGLKRYLSYVARLVSRAQSEREINKCLYGEAGAGGFIDIQDVYNVVVMRLPFKWRLEAENLGNKATSAVEFATILEHTFSKDQDFNARNEELMGGSLFEKNRKKTKAKKPKEAKSKDKEVKGKEVEESKKKSIKGPLNAETLAKNNSKEVLEEKLDTVIKAFATLTVESSSQGWSCVKDMKLDVPDKAPSAPPAKKHDPLESLRGNNYF
ncbi:hypothetical protein CJU89_1288 [Yarrowia sp. B02]|nr:hypothetical protein CJU89_1288 [Yarrowia sp. B02]